MIERYFIMRHGASEANLVGKVQGSQDVPLAFLGKQQAAQVGDLLRNQGITKIYTSPLQRALETGLIVGQRLSLQISILHDLRARNLGTWEGNSREEIKEMWNDLTHPFRSDPHFAPPQGESLLDAESRIIAAVQHVLQKGSALDVPLFVMHLIGTSAILHHTKQERISLGNAEVWEIHPSQRMARSAATPPDPKLAGVE